MPQFKTSRKLAYFFLFVATISLMNHISISFYYTIWITPMQNHSKNRHHIKPRYLQIVPVNISQNSNILSSYIICGENVSCDDGNVSKVVPAESHVAKDGLYYYFQSYESEKNELCPPIPPNLGPVPEDKSIIGLYGIENMYIDIVTGGMHSPTACIARQNAAIIVPLHETNKSMKSYLTSFIYYMHPFLMQQMLEYQLFVILKQNASHPYKRGELYNIGFEVAQTQRPEGWQCLVFHDAHIVPEDTRNMYRCGQYPRRLLADMRKPYRFGGAVALTPEQFVASNGFSNLAWNEDNDYIDMYRRLVLANYSIETNIPRIGKYASLQYLEQLNYNITRQQTLSLLQYNDGYNNVKLKIESIEYKQLYTLVTVSELSHEIS